MSRTNAHHARRQPDTGPSLDLAATIKIKSRRSIPLASCTVHDTPARVPSLTCTMHASGARLHHASCTVHGPRWRLDPGTCIPQSPRWRLHHALCIMHGALSSLDTGTIPPQSTSRRLCHASCTMHVTYATGRPDRFSPHRSGVEDGSRGMQPTAQRPRSYPRPRDSGTTARKPLTRRARHGGLWRENKEDAKLIQNLLPSRPRVFPARPSAGTFFTNLFSQAAQTGVNPVNNDSPVHEKTLQPPACHPERPPPRKHWASPIDSDATSPHSLHAPHLAGVTQILRFYF